MPEALKWHLEGALWTTRRTLFNLAPTVAPLTVSGLSNTVVNGRVDATDPENDAIVYRLVRGPSSGTVALNADGSFTYTPPAELRRRRLVRGGGPGPRSPRQPARPVPRNRYCRRCAGQPGRHQVRLQLHDRREHLDTRSPSRIEGRGRRHDGLLPGHEAGHAQLCRFRYVGPRERRASLGRKRIGRIQRALVLSDRGPVQDDQRHRRQRRGSRRHPQLELGGLLLGARRFGRKHRVRLPGHRDSRAAAFVRVHVHCRCARHEHWHALGGVRRLCRR